MALTEIPIELSSTPSIVDNGNATAITIDSSENVGIGRTSITQPSSGATTLAIQGTDTTKGGAIRLYSSDDSVAAYIYPDNSNGLSINTSTSHPIIFRTAGTERMRIDASGNVGIGNSSPSSYFSPQLVVHSSVNLGGITIRSNATTDTNYLLFADGISGNERYRGYVSYDHNTDTMKLATGASPAITIDASGNVGIGATTYEGSVTSNASSVWISSAGYLSANINNDWGLGVNRTGTDGTLINFRKNGANVGSIGTTTSAAGTRFAIGAVGDPGIIFAGTGVFPATQITASDNSVDLGSGTYRWKDIFLSGGVNFSVNANAAGMTSELLDDYETGTWTPTLAGHYGTYGMTFNQGNRIGKYTKVGNLVTLSMEISSAGVAASGNGDIIVITGLPFTIGSPCVGSHAHTSIASFAGGGWTAISSTAFGHLGNNGTVGSGWAWMTGGNVSTSGVAIRLTISYRH